jgi:hypothetical protein
MLSNTNLYCAMLNWIASLHFSDEIVFMHSAGFFHLAGTIPAFALTLAGGTNVCLPKFDAELGLAARPQARQHGISVGDRGLERPGVWGGEVGVDHIDVRGHLVRVADHGGDLVTGGERLVDQVPTDATGCGEDGESHGAVSSGEGVLHPRWRFDYCRG